MRLLKEPDKEVCRTHVARIYQLCLYIYQIDGESSIPTVSCQGLHLPRYATRDQEVLAMSLFYKNILMESFLYFSKYLQSYIPQ